MKHHKVGSNRDSKPRDQPAPTPVAVSKISRRNFVQKVGTGAVGATIGSGFLFSPSSASAQDTWQHEADIVVVGTGAAGSSAALNAQRLGSSVLILEKAASYGGTTAKSGGGYWIPNNSLMRTQGIQDSRKDALRYMIRVAYPQLYNREDSYLGVSSDQYELIAAFYDNAAPALDALQSMTTVRSKTVLDASLKPEVDYRADLSEDNGISGRSLRTTSGGGKGADLIAQLKEAVVQRQIPVLLSHRAVRLLLNQQREVVGLEATTHDGTASAVRARKAVIFCSGGFGHNREFRLNFLRGPIFGSCTVPTNEGDFIYIATAAGASLANMGNAWWNEIVLEMALAPSSTPRDIPTLSGDSMIAVNRYGLRIVSEQIDYNDRGQTHFVWDPRRDDYSNLLTFMIYDQRTADRSADSFPIPARGSSAPYVLSGQTIEELVRAIEARLEKLANYTGNFRLDAGFRNQLEQSIARFNRFAERGIDEDFHRGEGPYELGHHPVTGNKGNPSIFPISTKGPYYAIIIAAGTLDTHGGPKINARAQIVDASGKPIPGLYGAGNCVGFGGQAYWGLGSTIGPALTFGYIAAREASKEIPKQV